MIVPVCPITSNGITFSMFILIVNFYLKVSFYIMWFDKQARQTQPSKDTKETKDNNTNNRPL